MNPGTWAIIGLSIFLALWYGGGHLFNRRRGQRLLRWLEAGLDTLGGEREAGWIGSSASGARVNVTHASSPFRRLEITLLLENREIPLLWLIDRLRGRGDRLIIRGTLRSPRRGKVKVSSTGSRVQAAPKAKASRPWTQEEGPHGLTVAYQGQTAKRQVMALRTWLETYGAHLNRFSWRKHDPHIVLQMRIAGLLKISAETFLSDLSGALRAHVKS